MSKTMQQIVDQIGVLIDDTNHDRFSEVVKQAQANTELGTTVSTFLLCYVREDDVQVRQGDFTYTLPDDLLDVVAITADNISGERIVQRSYEEAARFGNLHRPYRIDEPSTWDTGSWSGNKYFVRDLNSDSQFILSPSYDGGTYTESDGWPSSFSEGALYVDTGDENAVYYCDTAYTSTGYAELTWGRTTTDLVFKAVESGTTWVEVAIVDGGASGSILPPVIAGAGVQSDPFVYTFTLYDDDNSNDAIIALLDGDDNLGATGSKASSETYNAFSVIALVNEGAATLTWNRTTADLQFMAVASGTTWIEVAMVDGGASGSISPPVITGAGTRTDPYIYTFTVYDAANDNDSIIALLSSDANLSASGSDDTTEAYTAFSDTPMTNAAEANFTAKTLHIRYTATLPELPLLADTLHSSMPAMVVRSNCVAQLAAAELIEADPGGDKTMAQLFRSKAFKTMGDAIGHRNREPLPSAVGPG